jgi:hypothetical protein
VPFKKDYLTIQKQKNEEKSNVVAQSTIAFKK